MLSNQKEARTIWINADLGEGCPNDEALFQLVHWANIACGGHAGDESSIRLACLMATEYGVQVGAHPSYPDREGFGRSKPTSDPRDLLDDLKRQMDLFENTAAKMGCLSRHFKPHGQLYNDAAFNQPEAELLIRLAQAYPHLSLLALAGSPQVEWCRRAGVVVLEEAFPDRCYMADGSLVPRSMAGALIGEPDNVKAQAESLLRGGPLRTLDGSKLFVDAQTLCVHGDSLTALENAKAVKAAWIEHNQDMFSGAD